MEMIQEFFEWLTSFNLLEALYKNFDISLQPVDIFQLLILWIVLCVVVLFFTKYVYKGIKSDKDYKKILKNTKVQSLRDEKQNRASGDKKEEKKKNAINDKIEKTMIEAGSVGLVINLNVYIALSAVIGLGSYFLFLAMNLGGLVSIYLAALLALTPFIGIQNKIVQKRDDLSQKFYTVTNAIISGLKSGRSMKDVIGELRNSDTIDPFYRMKMAQVYTDISVTSSPTQAFMRLYHETGVQEIERFAQKLDVSQETGADLITMLISLQSIYQGEQTLKLKKHSAINSNISQAKIITWCVSALLIFIAFTNRTYFSALMDSILGQIAACILLTIVFAGNIMLKRYAYKALG